VNAAGNPIAKIPTLVVDDFPDGNGASVAIFDSKFICEYLLQRAGVREDQSRKRYWQEKAVHAACDGMTDAEILVIYEERLREAKGLKWQPWVDGQREKEYVMSLNGFSSLC
jgi:glutathione S-transferase